MKGYEPTPEEMQQFIDWRRESIAKSSTKAIKIQASDKRRLSVEEQAAIDAALNSIYNGQ